MNSIQGEAEGESGTEERRETWPRSEGHAGAGRGRELQSIGFFLATGNGRWLGILRDNRCRTF